MACESDVKAIRDWLVKQPHLPQTLDDSLIMTFLNCCDGSLERTKATMELFFTLRADIPETFSDRDPLAPRIQQTLSIIDLFALPTKTPEGYNCFLFHFNDPDPDKFNFLDFVKTFFMVGDTRVRTQKELVAGEVAIFDMKGWSIKHLTKVPLTAVSKYMKYCQEAQPVKLRQLHVINSFSLLDKVLSFVRPYMNSEVAAMLHIHPAGSESLYQYIPRDMLPVEYGGKAGTTKKIKETWKLKVEEQKEWFQKNEWMSDESKRIGKRKEMFKGGSFKSMSID